MLTEFTQQYGNQIQNFMILLMLVNAILHVIFAGGIARDAGNLYKIGQKTALVSAPTWAFATLIGGVVVAAIYWFIHHSTLTRPVSREKNYE
ncbi:hypothetical protein E3983_04595 [Legionella israelensis]|uniref:Uncharacterized protein n=1 Tax=Legionella israelensis TaxID=454 RepID=A0AAX1EF03_9GAMM|nr:hypothetical protein [Legionella israelensis]QBR83695.1 hypothetical protein E3983_04595 [Legionella israelensis]